MPQTTDGRVHVANDPEESEPGPGVGACGGEELLAFTEGDRRISYAVDEEKARPEGVHHTDGGKGPKEGLDLFGQSVESQAYVPWSSTGEDSRNGPSGRSEAALKLGVFQGFERPRESLCHESLVDRRDEEVEISKEKRPHHLAIPLPQQVLDQCPGVGISPKCQYEVHLVPNAGVCRREQSRSGPHADSHQG